MNAEKKPTGRKRLAKQCKANIDIRAIYELDIYLPLQLSGSQFFRSSVVWRYHLYQHSLQCRYRNSSVI